MLGNRSREKQTLGTAFPTTHSTYKRTWLQPAHSGFQDAPRAVRAS